MFSLITLHKYMFSGRKVNFASSLHDNNNNNIIIFVHKSNIWVSESEWLSECCLHLPSLRCGWMTLAPRSSSRTPCKQVNDLPSVSGDTPVATATYWQMWMIYACDLIQWQEGDTGRRIPVCIISPPNDYTDGSLKRIHQDFCESVLAWLDPESLVV